MDCEISSGRYIISGSIYFGARKEISAHRAEYQTEYPVNTPRTFIASSAVYFHSATRQSELNTPNMASATMTADGILPPWPR